MTLAVIEAAKAAGIHLEACNGQLKLTAKDRPDAQLLEQIQNHKASIINELEGVPCWRSSADLYYQHHWICSQCQQAGQRLKGDGQRCPDGLALWLAYQRAAR